MGLVETREKNVTQRKRGGKWCFWGIGVLVSKGFKQLTHCLSHSWRREKRQGSKRSAANRERGEGTHTQVKGWLRGSPRIRPVPSSRFP